ncbi:MAG: biotin--[acetyl-CoA-carboxylase] ligase [Planctomycetaceae bacterium]
MPAPSPQLESGPDPLDVAALRAAGFATVVHRAEVGSTMDEARPLAADPATALPAVVVADRQAAGRGRRGAAWWQAPGALAASIVIDGGDAGPPRPTWALACGVALAEAIRHLEPAVAAVVRWPNDVEAGGRKLAGILVETAAHARAVVGIGVNTTGSAAAAPEALRHRVGTLPDITGRALCRGTLLAAFLPRFVELVESPNRDGGALARRYRPLCALDGTVITLHAGAERHTGVCRGITASGALVIDTPTGRREFTSGSLTDPAAAWTGDAAGPEHPTRPRW